MIWEYYSLFAYDKQAIFAYEYFADGVVLQIIHLRKTI